MKSFAVSLLLLSLLSPLHLVLASVYYVTPHASTTCPKTPCHTLSEYVSSPPHGSSEISMIFMEGEHTLSGNLTLDGLNSLSLTTVSSGVAVVITCSSTGRLVLKSINNVVIRGINLVGCDGNIMTSSHQLLIEQCLVQGSSNKTPSREVFNVSGILNVTITNSTFAYNKVTAIDESLVCSVLKALKSNVTIIHSEFHNNSVVSTSFPHNGHGSVLCSLNTTLTVQQSNLADNQALTGGVIYANHSTIFVHGSTFVHNHATICGGAVYASHISNITMDGGIFEDNNSSSDGGVLCITQGSKLTAGNCVFEGNSAHSESVPTSNGGVLLLANSSEATFTNGCVFTENIANEGGVIQASNQSRVNISDSILTGNRGISPVFGYGDSGVVNAENHTYVTLRNSTFRNNHASTSGGCAQVNVSCVLQIYDSCVFENNSAVYGGVFSVWTSTLSINTEHYYSTGKNNTCSNNTLVNFVGNSAQHGGALNIIQGSSAKIFCVNFEDNHADYRGGAILARTYTSVNLTDVNLGGNSAVSKGGAFFAQLCSIHSHGYIHAHSNLGGYGVFFLSNCNFTFNGNTTFVSNDGSFLAQNSYIAFLGETSFQNGRSNSTEGGALTALRSTVSFYERTNLQGNTGSALLAVESRIINYGVCTFNNNSAKDGGAIYAYNTHLIFRGEVTFEDNEATDNGGAIYALSSTIHHYAHSAKYKRNAATTGGAIYIDKTSLFYVIKEIMECRFNVWYCNHDPKEWLVLTFEGNLASEKGGALFVYDVDAGSCSSMPSDSIRSHHTIYEVCFLQSIAVYVSANDWNMTRTNFANINFTGNAAPKGPLMYGGLLDRCAIDRSAEVPESITKPLDYLSQLSLTNILSDEIASDPVRVCFCVNYTVDCSEPPPSVEIKRGQTFNLTLVAVNNVGLPVSSVILADLSSKSSRMGKDQSKQSINDTCTQLQYTIFSADSEILSLYADGPCSKKGISRADVNVTIDSSCPPGFQLSDASLVCECDPDITQYVSNCSIDTESVEREGHFWMSSTSDGNNTDVIVHDHCPYDYCYPPTTSVDINLTNSENGSDSQCAFHRSGILCGSCKDGYSLTLGSSRCEQCSNYWLLLILPFGVAGLALVVLMMSLHITLASGTINGLLFYANVVIANRASFFPFEQQNFLTVFVSWLGLNLGIATCFYDGMDGFGKMWMQLSFEFYLIFLMIVIIALGRSVRVSNFFYRCGINPVHTLATLIMLSYEKLSRKIFLLLSFTRLTYPNGTVTVWLFEPGLKYMSTEHISLVVVACVILVLGILFNFILLFGKLLIAKSRSVYFNNFMEAFYAPFRPNHQYWVGLLLLIRTLCYFNAEFINAGGDPSNNLHFVFTSVLAILLIKLVYVSTNNLRIVSLRDFVRQGYARLSDSVHSPTLRGVNDSWCSESVVGSGIVYKNPFVDLLETSFLVNISILTYFTLYLKGVNQGQDILFYVSASVALLTFVGIVVHHVFKYTMLIHCLRRIFCRDRENPQVFSSEYDTNPPTSSEITPFH